MEALQVAIVTRWDAAALNTSIAPLYSGGPGNKSANAAGSPTGSGKPRAEFEVSVGAPRQSRNSRIAQAVAVIKIWGTPAAVPGYVQSVRDALVNSEAAVSNPMTMSGGDVLEVNDGGSLAIKVDDNTSLGRQMLVIKFRINNRRPA